MRRSGSIDFAIPPSRKTPYKMDLFCVAEFGLVSHLIRDVRILSAFRMLEDNPGVGIRRGNVEDARPTRGLFTGLGSAIYEAHEARRGDAVGAAIHFAFDFWADWYDYAFANAQEYLEAYPELFFADPHKYFSNFIRDIFGNPFRPVAFDPSWRTSTALAIAQGIYDDRAFDRLPILADALQDAGCENADLLNHLRSEGPHVKGCWALDLVLGKE